MLKLIIGSWYLFFQQFDAFKTFGTPCICMEQWLTFMDPFRTTSEKDFSSNLEIYTEILLRKEFSDQFTLYFNSLTLKVISLSGEFFNHWSPAQGWLGILNPCCPQEQNLCIKMPWMIEIGENLSYILGFWNIQKWA